MKVLIVPMFALSAMNGPWSRAVTVAEAFARAGHEAVLGFAPDGNCRMDCGFPIVELPVPSPLGAPMAIAKRTFPLAQRLGIAGRKAVRSFEEVLWLTGNLAYSYLRESVDLLADELRDGGYDAVYSEFSLPAIIAAQAVGVSVFGSVSYPTQASFASVPAKAKGLRMLLSSLGLPPVESSLELFERLERRFVPSCREFESFEEGSVEFCGFLKPASEVIDGARDAIVFYLGTGSVPIGKLVRTVVAVAASVDAPVYLAGVDEAGVTGAPPNLHAARRFDFSELLPCTKVFIHHGGQNSLMDGLRYGVPQIIYPGKVFERQYNAVSVEGVGAGLVLGDFTAEAILAGVDAVFGDRTYGEAAAVIRQRMGVLGGADRIVASVSAAIAR